MRAMKTMQVGIALGVWLATMAAQAATYTWTGNSGTWDNTNTANWSGGTIPVIGHQASLSKSTTTNITIQFASTWYTNSATALYGTSIGNTGGGVTYFNVGMDLYMGTAGFAINSGGYVLHTNGTVNVLVGGTPFVIASNGVYCQSGGVVSVTGSASVRGLYEMPAGGNGSATFYGIEVKNGGEFRVKSGTVSDGQGGLTIGGAVGTSPGYVNVYDGVMNNGSITLGNAGPAVLHQYGGKVYTGASSTANKIYIGNATNATQSSEYILEGGDFGTVVGRPFGPYAMYVYAGSSFRGRGVFVSTDFAQSTLDNSGRIVADGFGVETNLDIPIAGSFMSATTNNPVDGSNGWYAVRGGRLILVAKTYSAAAKTNTWGEMAGTNSIDMVNSAQIKLSAITGSGAVTGLLYSVDRSDVPALPAGSEKFLSVHEFVTASGITALNGTVTIRYDHTAVGDAAREADLRLLQYNGSAWSDVTGGRDLGTRTIVSVPVTALGKFAVSLPPRPKGTVIGIR